MSNLVVHFEFHASEPERLIDFYSKLFGWRFEEYGGGEQPYWVIDTGEGAIGNADRQAGVDGLMRRGVELGGTEALPATDWPGIGRGGYLLDPDGNVFGLISPVLSDGTVTTGAGAEA
jgi:uncharacterized protein